MYTPVDNSNELNLVSDVVTLDIKKIPGTIGYYASRCGKIFGTDKQDILYELNSYLNNNGYLSITLRATKVTDKDLINHRAMVHRLIAITFVEGYKKGLVVDHIDRNRTNNHANNLRWVTVSANNSRSVRTYKKPMVSLVFKCYCRNINTGEIKEFNSRREAGYFLGLRTGRAIPPDSIIFKTQRGQLFKNEWEVSLFKDQWDYIDIDKPKKPGFCIITIRDQKGNLVDKMFNKQELYYKYKLWNPHLETGGNLVEKYITKFNLLYPDLTIEYDDTPKPSYKDILEKVSVEKHETPLKKEPKILVQRARRNKAVNTIDIEANKEPKRRGRPPIIREPEEPKEPKRRGRPPIVRVIDPSVIIEPKRRGRPPIVKEPKVPKRRGRPPIARERIKAYKNLINKEVIQMEDIETGETKQYRSFREASRKIGICRKQLQSIIDTNKIYKKKYTFKKCASPK